MKFLLDTNVFLEVMLGQAQAAAAQQLLTQGQKHELVISDFSLHSIGCHLFRRDKMVEFKQFFQDMVLVGGVQISALAEDQYDRVADAAVRFRDGQVHRDPPRGEQKVSKMIVLAGESSVLVSASFGFVS